MLTQQAAQLDADMQELASRIGHTLNMRHTGTGDAIAAVARAITTLADSAFPMHDELANAAMQQALDTF